ncbi:MAG: protease modulator HflC [Planctomycetota bacterium]
MRPFHMLVVLAAIAALVVLSGSLYTVSETEVVILTQFGRPVGEPVVEPGLHLKTPFVQDVNRLEKRVLEWDGASTEMPTKDKMYIQVDSFARWRISDPATYFVALRDERSAQSRLDDIIGSEVRAAVAGHELIEIIRSDTKRVLPIGQQARGDGNTRAAVVKRGRRAIEEDVLAASKPKLAPLGIELLDVRVKRVNYNNEVLQRIYQRMISERQQIAQRFRSEGEGEAARINGKRERDLREVESEAYKQVQKIRGEADAEATRIYAEAYDQSPEAAEFYSFLKTLETWRAAMRGSTVVLSTDSDLFRLLKDSGAGK